MDAAAANRPVIDPLELARGALSAFSYEADQRACEVHISSLIRQFDRAGVVAASPLDLMRLLREAESLGNGYWIPAPLRVVSLGDSCSLVVGAHPTQELRRHFPSVRRAGAGRVACAGDIALLPVQALASWMGHDGHSAAVWAAMQVEAAAALLAPSVATSDLEEFTVSQRKPSSGNAPGWIRFEARDGLTWQGVRLCRQRTGRTKHRFFLARREAGSMLLEGPPVGDVWRMQYGLAALAGQPLTCILSQASDDERVLTLPLPARGPLQRLLVALCETDPRYFGAKWHCRDEYVPLALEALHELSAEVTQHG